MDKKSLLRTTTDIWWTILVCSLEIQTKGKVAQEPYQSPKQGNLWEGTSRELVCQESMWDWWQLWRLELPNILGILWSLCQISRSFWAMGQKCQGKRLQRVSWAIYRAFWCKSFRESFWWRSICKTAPQLIFLGQVWCFCLQWCIFKVGRIGLQHWFNNHVGKAEKSIKNMEPGFNVPSIWPSHKVWGAWSWSTFQTNCRIQGQICWEEKQPRPGVVCNQNELENWRISSQGISTEKDVRRAWLKVSHRRNMMDYLNLIYYTT